MPIGRTQEEQALNSLLAKTLVQKEVMEPMSKIGWSHGSPPPPDYSEKKEPEPGSGQPAPGEGAPGRAAAPAAKPEGGQPAPKAEAKPAPAGESKADGPTKEDGEAIIALYESLRDPKTGLIVGKYKTVAAAIKGSGHLANMAKQAYRERDEAVARFSAKPAAGDATAPAASPAAAPAKPTVSLSRVKLDEAQARLDEVLSSIVENGQVLDAEAAKKLSKAQRELADAAADFRVREARLQEKNTRSEQETKWQKVDEYMSSNHPESARFSEEVALHVESDPVLKAGVNALLVQEKLLEATLLAWNAFQKAHADMLSAEERAKAEEKEIDLAAREQVRKEAVDAARKDAGIVNGSAGGAGAHEGGESGPSREEIAAARDAMRREGEAPGSPAAMRFRQLVIGPSLDPRIFGPGA